MKPSRFAPGLFRVMVILAMGLWVLACGGGGEGKAGSPGGSSGREPSAGELRAFTLFFPGTGEALVKEERRLPTGETEEEVRAVVQALLDGPETPEARRALPKDTTIGGVYLGSAAVAYLDLHRPENQPPPPMGSLQETLMVYSVVNSVVLNVQEVERLSILWNGVQHPSLAGHLSNGGPLEPRPQLSR